jgi:hypothetical protein
MLLQVVAVLMRDRLYDILRSLDGLRFLFATLIVLTVLSAGVVTLAAARFRRSRLVR